MNRLKEPAEVNDAGSERQANAMPLVPMRSAASADTSQEQHPSPNDQGVTWIFKNEPRSTGPPSVLVDAGAERRLRSEPRLRAAFEARDTNYNKVDGDSNQVKMTVEGGMMPIMLVIFVALIILQQFFAK
ncbi:hypothetical protein F4680DRAFT_453106 [Xylaria scruposa]|nr:hypothetical protein F4680DRAFT_453106 [Xylaria scruposa]